MWVYVIVGLIIGYLVLGVLTSFILMQTPYAENPLWAMILLWPLYWIQGI